MSTSTLNRKIVIGLTGPIGSGVSTAAETLEQKLSFKRIRLSDLIKRELGTASTEGRQSDRRIALQNHGNAKRNEQGRDYWVRQAALENETGNIVIEGVRNLGEVEYLREHFHWFFLFAMDAPRTIRWDRVREQYEGNEAAFNRDDERDTGEEDIAGQQVGKCVSDADYVMKNHEQIPYSGTRMEKMEERFKRELGHIRGDSLRRPDRWEVSMATAYAQSLGSECIKRNVGAVIVDPKDIPLSLGFNENPVPMRPCKYLFNGCYKDQDMFAKLERMRDVFCPKCGTKQEGQLRPPWECFKRECKEDLKSAFFRSRNMEVCTAIHAEERAIRSLSGKRAPGATMYVTTCPCFQCARYIIDAGIVRVLYVEAYPVKESIEFLQSNGVVIEPFEGFKARAYTRLFKGAE